MPLALSLFARFARCARDPAMSALALIALPVASALAGTSDPTVAQVASSLQHTCALTTAGAVKCWGVNFNGQLGNVTNSGTENPNNVPLDVQTLGSGVVAIANGQMWSRSPQDGVTPARSRLRVRSNAGAAASMANSAARRTRARSRPMMSRATFKR